jgi:titin
LILGAGSSGSTIRGLVINRFTRIAAGNSGGNPIVVSIAGASGGHWIAGNYLNTDSTGTTTFLSSEFSTSRDGIVDGGSGGNIIGHDPLGPNSSNPAADRNIISGAGTAPAGGARNGILVLVQSSGNKIRGNYIGTDATGTLDLGNPLSGILVQSASNTIVDNVISGNGFNGVRSTSANPLIPSGSNVIVNNKVGTDVTGTLDLGNDNDGVHLGTSNNTVANNVISGNFGGVFAPGPGSNTIKDNKIGTDVTGMLPIGNAAGMVVISSNNTIKGNVIAFNDSVGIIALPSTTGVPSVSNAILSNSIFGNPGFGLSGLGIELATSNCPPSCIFDGVTLNDPLDEDVGFANNLQNFPVIDVADSFINPPHVQVRVRLDSKPNQDYLIQGFLSTLADPSGHGEGEVLVAQKIVTTDDSGHVDFRLPVPLKLLPVRSIFTTTATDLLTNDTSEFSKWENLDDVQDVRGSPTAYEQVGDAVGDDGMDDMPWSSWEERAAEEPSITEKVPTEE